MAADEACFKIQLGDRERTLYFGMAQMRALDKALGGRSVMQLITQGHFGVWLMSEALLVGLSTHHPKVTMVHIDRWLDAGKAEGPSFFRRLAETVSQALAAAMGVKPGDVAVEAGVGDDPDDDPDGARPLDKAAAPKGLSSSPTADLS